MTKDLEETLNELGPEYREVVARLQGCAVPRAALGRGVATPGCNGATAGGISRYGEWLRAAALALLLFLPCVFIDFSPSRPHALSPSRLPNPYRLAETVTPAAVAEIVRTQQADGSWATDFLTRRNALALKDQAGADAQLAYRKAMRNLRLRGLL